MRYIIAAFLALVSSAFASTLVWDASPVADQVEQYIVYEKTGTNYIEIARVVLPAWPIPQGTVGPKTYAVTAVNVQGQESELSDDATLLGKPGKPQRPRIIK